MADDENKSDDRLDWFQSVVQAAFPSVKPPKLRKAWADLEMQYVCAG